MCKREIMVIFFESQIVVHNMQKNDVPRKKKLMNNDQLCVPLTIFLFDSLIVLTIQFMIQQYFYTCKNLLFKQLHKTFSDKILQKDFKRFEKTKD